MYLILKYCLLIIATQYPDSLLKVIKSILKV